MSRFSCAFLVLLAGCSAPEVAPTELSDLSLFFFASFDSGTEPLLAEGLANLEQAVLADADLDGARGDRQWQLPVLSADHLGGAVAPEGQDPNAQIGVSVARRSDHAIALHVPAILLPDQSPLDPSAPVYDRTFEDGDDCFEGRGCDRLDCMNAITKSNILLEVAYEAPKDYRHITLLDGRPGLISRTWNDRVWVGEAGANSIDQTFAIDLFIEDPDDPTRSTRYFALWSAVTLSIDADEDLIRGTMALGSDSLLARQDAFITDGL